VASPVIFWLSANSEANTATDPGDAVVMMAMEMALNCHLGQRKSK
jgi:hypothetical protein